MKRLTGLGLIALALVGAFAFTEPANAQSCNNYNGQTFGYQNPGYFNNSGYQNFGYLNNFANSTDNFRKKHRFYQGRERRRYQALQQSMRPWYGH